MHGFVTEEVIPCLSPSPVDLPAYRDIVLARFANPQSILLPGMFVTAEFAQAIDTSAFLVPQQAVSRDPQGNATLFVIGPGNRAVQRTVVADRTQGP